MTPALAVPPAEPRPCGCPCVSCEKPNVDYAGPADFCACSCHQAEGATEGRSLWSNPRAVWATPLRPELPDFRDLTVTKAEIEAALAKARAERRWFYR